jgi:adenylate cyclase class IV
LEVVLDEHDSIESGEAEAERLMLHLNIQVSELIDVAYVDLLEQQTA